MRDHPTKANFITRAPTAPSPALFHGVNGLQNSLRGRAAVSETASWLAEVRPYISTSIEFAKPSIKMRLVAAIASARAASIEGTIRERSSPAADPLGTKGRGPEPAAAPDRPPIAAATTPRTPVPAKSASARNEKQSTTPIPA